MSNSTSSPPASEALSNLASRIDTTIDPDTQRQLIAETASTLLKSLRVPFTGMTVGAEKNGSSYSVYPEPRGSESAAVVVIARDAESGERMILLEQKKARGGQSQDTVSWEFPAGFRTVVPEAGVVSSSAEGSNMQPPTEENLRIVVKGEIDRMIREGQTASEIKERFENPEAMQTLFAEHGIGLSPDIDITLKHTALREVKEETGVDLAALHADVRYATSFSTSSYGSSANRINHTDHLFVADLGTVSNFPTIKLNGETEAEQEIAKAAWVPLKNITLNNGQYSFTTDHIVAPKDVINALRSQGAQTIDQINANRIETGLAKYTDMQIENASMIETAAGRTNRFDSIHDVYTEVARLADKQPLLIGEFSEFMKSCDLKGHVGSLMGKEGQHRMELFERAAAGLKDGDAPLTEIFPTSHLNRLLNDNALPAQFGATQKRQELSFVDKIFSQQGLPFLTH